MKPEEKPVENISEALRTKEYSLKEVKIYWEEKLRSLALEHSNFKKKVMLKVFSELA